MLDHGTEFTSPALDGFTYTTPVIHACTRLGEQSGIYHIESFKARSRDVWLNAH